MDAEGRVPTRAARGAAAGPGRHFWPEVQGPNLTPAACGRGAGGGGDPEAQGQPAWLVFGRRDSCDAIWPFFALIPGKRETPSPSPSLPTAEVTCGLPTRGLEPACYNTSVGTCSPPGQEPPLPPETSTHQVCRWGSEAPSMLTLTQRAGTRLGLTRPPPSRKPRLRALGLLSGGNTGPSGRGPDTAPCSCSRRVPKPRSPGHVQTGAGGH